MLQRLIGNPRIASAKSPDLVLKTAPQYQCRCHHARVRAPPAPARPVNITGGRPMAAAAKAFVIKRNLFRKPVPSFLIAF